MKNIITIENFVPSTLDAERQTVCLRQNEELEKGEINSSLMTCPICGEKFTLNNRLCGYTKDGTEKITAIFDCPVCYSPITLKTDNV